jgi:hypothetical protein
MGETCNAQGRGNGLYEILVGKPEGKRLLGRPRHRWDDDFRKDVREIGGKLWTGFIWLRIGISGVVF